MRVMKCRVLLSTNPLPYLTCTWTDNSGLVSSKRYIEIVQNQFMNCILNYKPYSFVVSGKETVSSVVNP